MKSSREKLKKGKGIEPKQVAPASIGIAQGHSRWVAPLLVVLLTLMAFLPVLLNEFVNWDDYETLLDNPHYRGLGWTQLSWMFTTFYMGHYQPLSWLTFGLDYLLWGMEPLGYHLTNLLIHAVNAALFYFIGLRLLPLGLSSSPVPRDFSLPTAAGFAALLFAVHPLRVESVAWATERRDVLSSLFFLWTILCYLRATAVTTGQRARMWWMNGGLIVYTLSLLSKASGIILPAVLLVLDVYPLRRLSGGPRKWFGSEARRVWWEKVPFLLLAVTFGIVALLAQREAGALKPLESYGPTQRLAQALFGIAFYLWKTIAPMGLSPLYEIPARFSLSDWPFLVTGLVVLVISVVFIIAGHRWPAWLACWVCYIVTLAPVLGIAQSGVQFVADRYSYLSCLAWALLGGAGIFYGWQLWGRGRLGERTFFSTMGLAAVVVIGLGLLTWRQAQVWHDSETLWRHVLAVDPDSSLAHNNLGNALFRRDKLEEAIKHYRQAIEIDPNYARAHYNLGYALANQGKREEAIEHYRQTLQIDPTIVEADINMGNLLVQKDKFEEGIGHYRHALELRPGDSKTHFRLGAALAKQGRLEEAAEHFQQAVEIRADFAEAFHYLGLVLAAQGDLNNAIEHFRHALRIQPEFAEAHESLGRALAQQGKRAEAAQHYQEALRILKSHRHQAEGNRQ